ncbi:hypothetical protein CDAR_242541 [Caerostris darwini]|uniref:Uncharacterized protein n=1 Tax=Caerostris darwini TaxID=1538125 RepID=A0AAV4UMI6_9ARAC|nr:hypothetical protein CDAR_242541 [Caerostris darwini]
MHTYLAPNALILRYKRPEGPEFLRPLLPCCTLDEDTARTVLKRTLIIRQTKGIINIDIQCHGEDAALNLCAKTKMYSRNEFFRRFKVPFARAKIF